MDLLDRPPLGRDAKSYEGLVKLKLLHAQGFTVLLPDVLAIGSHWFQARFFTAPLLSYLPEGQCCQFSFELDDETRLLVRFTGDRLLSHQPDGSSVYRCRIEGPPSLELRADGECELDANGNIALWLFHHTEPATLEAIRASGHFRGSPWNIQGTAKKLVNIQYAYFTSLPRIASDRDLERIAMSSKGLIRLTRTNAPKDVILLKVYRESTANRRASMRVLIPAHLLASQHVYYEAPHGGIVYYSVCHPEIFRVGLSPGHALTLSGDHVTPLATDIKRFDYVVLGDADTRTGLRAPYDEEQTSAIFKIERMEPGSDLFTLWRRHANTDRFSGYAVETATFRGA